MDARLEGALGPVSDFVFGLGFEAIPETTTRQAALLLLDTLGVAAAARSLEAGRIGRETAAALFAAGPGQPSARLLFDGRRASPAGAAYGGATQIDNLDGHDGYNPTKGHIGVAVVPALAAFAETLPALSGRQALSSLVLGYEIASRAGVALHETVADYHTSGAWNALAVAAMGARLRGLSADQLRQALGIAEYHGPRSQMMREIDNPSMLHDGSGWGALAGVTAVFLAENGFTGAPAVIVEAAEVAGHWSDLGVRWLTDLQYLKPYPVCRWAHAPIDGALALRQAHGLDPEDIKAVEIATFHESARLAQGMPASSPEAQYSLAFPVAAALARGRVGVNEVTGESLRDPVIARLVAAIRVREDETYNARFPEGRWGEVTVLLRDGRRLESGPKNARGGPDEPLSSDEVLDKFRDFATPVLGQARTREIESAVLGLGEPDADFARTLELITAP
jgi:2-methylcitrate dehydratase PrpD